MKKTMGIETGKMPKTRSEEEEGYERYTNVTVPKTKVKKKNQKRL